MELGYEPNLENGWDLESAVTRQETYPESFWIPTVGERMSLRTGDMAKLLFWFAGDDGLVGCERMWVTVTKVNGTSYEGKLKSLPRTSHVLKPGDIVAFGPDHIADIVRARRYWQAFGRLMLWKKRGS